MSQTQTVARLISRKCGATAMELIQRARTVSPTRRISDLRQAGWRIWREQVKGKNYGRYFGHPPVAR